MSHLTTNTDNLIRQELYSQELQRRFSDWLVGMPLFKDRTSEFPDGDLLYVDQIGQRTLKSYSENSPIDFSATDTARIELRVQSYVQDGFFITDELKMDSWKSNMLFSDNVRESTLAFERQIESEALATANQQILGDLNAINGQAHRFVASGTGKRLLLKTWLA